MQNDQKHRTIPNGHRQSHAARMLLLVVPLVVVAVVLLGSNGWAANILPNPALFRDPTGTLQTYSTTRGPLDLSNPFFQDLGTNGRDCGTCHVAGNGWTVSAAGVQARFEATGGLDPIFRPVDGSNSPNADVSTVEARRDAYSMLLNRAVIRIEMPISTTAEFKLAAVDDPYHYADAEHLSLFRRPLPATNLGFLSAVMWDGRETIVPIDSQSTSGPTTLALRQDLASQALHATLGHAQAENPPTDEQLQQIVDFELATFTAQSFDDEEGSLVAARAEGGAVNLSEQPFHIGINDPTGTTFNPKAMTLYDAWATLNPRTALNDQTSNAVRAAVVRGQALFNTMPITITGVAGLNDVLGQPVIHGTCTTCHNTPNVGNHSTAVPLNIGVADGSRRTLDLPLYTLQNKTTGELVTTTDPGRALITGRWADIGKVKGPILRGLAARAPYFQNGSAATLGDVIDFFEERFNVPLTQQQKDDLVTFLRTL